MISYLQAFADLVDEGWSITLSPGVSDFHRSRYGDGTITFIAKKDDYYVEGTGVDASGAIEGFVVLIETAPGWSLSHPNGNYPVARKCEYSGCDFTTVSRDDYWAHCYQAHIESSG